MNKKILITGGSGTIGSSIASKFIANDYSVINLDLKNTSKNDAMHTYVGDICDQDFLQEVALSEQSTEINHIVTVAGGGLKDEWDTFENVSLETFRKSIDLNLTGHINTIWTFYKNIKRATGIKSVTMISSINAFATYGLAGYSAAKAGLIGFMNAVADEFSKDEIRINVICPGTVHTNLTDHEEKKDWEKLRKGTITGYFVKPEDIADLVFSIAHNNAITAQSLIIDCGQMKKKK